MQTSTWSVWGTKVGKQANSIINTNKGERGALSQCRNPRPLLLS